nr:3'(2'),5'-bisphosphate nucleotidase CysQ [Prochlorococcus marinus]
MNKELELPEGVVLEDLLEKLRLLSWGASDILLAYSRGEKPPFGFPHVLNVKDSGDGPVSAADLAVNSWLLDGLKAHFPLISWSLISEETAKSSPLKDDSVKDEWLWVLDPLDGTKDFLLGTGEYAVHLALLNRNEPVLGVVLIPELEELWIGIIGIGTWCENRLMNKRKTNFSNRKTISEMILVASRSHRDEKFEKLLDSIPYSQKNLVGSVGCKISKILKGEADFYISLSGKTAPKDWDIAAPEVILRAAGGHFTYLNKTSICYNNGDINQWGCLVASHGKCHDLLCHEISRELLVIEASNQV